MGALALLSAGANAQAVNADQATRMYNRIAGIPPTAAELWQMLKATTAVAAALIATNDPKFLDDTIRNMAAPWTNRNQSVFVPLNDYTATVVGMVRDNVPFNTVLSADIIYVGDGTSGEGAYSPANNNMYINLDAANADLSVKLKKTTQSSLIGIPASAVAGVMTTRGRGERLLRQRHEPRDVPVHHDQPPLQRPADGDGHDPAARSHPPGRDAQPGRRQHSVLDQLHRLP